MLRSEQEHSSAAANLRISAKIVYAWLFVLSLLLVLLARWLPEPTEATRTVPFFWTFLLGVWLIEAWRPIVGRWALVLGLLGIIHGVVLWAAIPTALVLVVVPVGLAVSLVGVPAGLAMAAAESAILVLGGPRLGTGVDVSQVALTLLALWSVWGMLYLTKRSVGQMAQWSVANFERARALLDEARTRQSDLKDALDALAHANRQLALTYDKLAAAHAVAEEARRTKAAFVANVSHEFRTPLNMIIGLVDLLLETPEVYGERLPGPLLKDLEIVGRNCEHLSSMVNDVLDLSRIEAGRPSLYREQVPIRAIIDEALEAVRPLTTKKGLELAAQVPADLPLVYCDRTRIRQVVLNLLSNAARFTEQGGITVRAQRDDGHLRVEVSDTGPGILKSEAERIFEPFHQQSLPVRRQAGGTGLGLSISKQFVELHGGRMWLDSQVGVGSTFSFILPFTPPAEPSAPASRWIMEGWVERRVAPVVPETQLDRRLVLCDAAGELDALLARYDDRTEFALCRDVGEAIAQVRLCPAQALVVSAPQVEALLPLVRRARQDLPDTPVLGCVMPPRGAHTLAAGAAGFLLKPVTRADLSRALASMNRPVRDVLVVDDDVEASDLIARLVRANDPSIRVRTASSAAQALAELRRQPPEVVMMDIVMPDEDGWEALAEIQRDPQLKEIPVLIISAQDPQDQPWASEALLATVGGGIPISKVLRCLYEVSSLLVQPG